MMKETEKNNRQGLEKDGKPGRMKGILFILLAAFFFSLMSVFVRLSGDVPTMQKAFFRNLVAAAVAGILLLRGQADGQAKALSGRPSAGGVSGRGQAEGQAKALPGPPSGGGVSVKGQEAQSKAPRRVRRGPGGTLIQKGNLPDLLLRSIFGTLGVLANFWAVDHLGIADANMLNKLSPFFAILMSVFILREVPNRVEWISVAVAFVGAVLVAKPSSGIVSLPALVGIFGGFAAGTAYTYVRKLGLAGERGAVIVMFFSSFSTLVLLPNLLLHYSPMTGRQLAMLLLAGASAAGGQLSITAAYQHAPAREISVFDYSQVVYAAVFGIFLFGEFPDGFSIAGYVLIIGTAFAKWYLLK